MARVEAGSGGRRPRLVDLVNLERACGTAEREPALACLVEMIRRSDGVLWGIDAPFGLPVEIMDRGESWTGLLRKVRGFDGDAYDLGLWCVGRARARGGPPHIYRVTDRAARTPFDCYHYRIVYQTFHAMRDVLWPLHAWPATAILPFQYRRMGRARRVVVETCPSSTLKRLGLPHRHYKQPRGGPLAPLRRRTRRLILEGLGAHVEVSERDRRRLMRDGGADALDAVIAAVGVAQGFAAAPHEALARDERTGREGFVYA